ncbi:MAG: putative baseplate assembly protein [Pseudomonadota bacterium]
MSEAREQELLAALLRDLPGFTPELAPREQGAAHALLASFARLTSLLDAKAARLPERGLLAGLDMLGLDLLPARAARVPLIFEMQPDAPLDITLPAGSQVAAKPAPPPPDLEGTAAQEAEPVVFATERAVTLTPARLAAIYSVAPGSDRYADHSADAARGFALFEDMKLTPHHVYLGHDTLFNLAGKVALIVSFVFEQPSRTPVELVFEYCTEGGWLELPFNPEDDTTAGLVGDGQITLRHDCGPKAKKTKVAERESYWLRIRLASALVPEGIDPLITLNDLRVRAEFGKADLKLDAAANDGQALDASRDFYPFGRLPARGSTFALACKEAFSRPGAMVKVEFSLATSGTVPTGETLTLQWEYTAGNGWEAITPINDSPAVTFAGTSKTVLFRAPADWVEMDLAGAKQRWLRARITGGSFGLAVRVKEVLKGRPTFEGGNIRPPIVDGVRVSFHYQTDAQAPDCCFTYNDFRYEDRTAAALWPDQSFTPFIPVEGVSPAVHLGFDRTLPHSLVSLLLDVPDAPSESMSASPYVWEYLAADGWREFAVLDETVGFTRRGMIQFIGPPDAIARAGVGDVPCYWLRARVKQGELRTGGACSGLWVNAVWASERQRSEREILGYGDGNPGQSFKVRRAPVLAEEIVEVEEWVGRGEGWRNALPELEERDIRFERDPATRVPVAAWVRWSAREHFFESQAVDRHYVVERANGTVHFGVRAPDAGRRIAASYSSGGGIAANVAAGAAKELRTAAPYVTAVRNPLAARGGADTESEVRVLKRGPQHLRHRGRGISAEDIEWLALEASPEVARARCLSLRGPAGYAQRGWVSVAVVPHAAEARPVPSGELMRQAYEFLSPKLTAGARLRVLAPRYLPVSVRAVVVPMEAGHAALVEARVRRALDRYLHPLRGGAAGRGWEFGESVYLSQLAAVIEAVDGVEHAEDVVLSTLDVLAGMSLSVPRDELPCAGSHELVLRMGGV